MTIQNTKSTGLRPSKVFFYNWFIYFFDNQARDMPVIVKKIKQSPDHRFGVVNCVCSILNSRKILFEDHGKWKMNTKK